MDANNAYIHTHDEAFLMARFFESNNTQEYDVIKLALDLVQTYRRPSPADAAGQ
jgi:hypothetical protein